jgi:beta-galactosidase
VATGPGSGSTEFAELGLTRRAALRAGVLATAALAASTALTPGRADTAEAAVTHSQALSEGTFGLNQGWLFGGVYATGSEAPGYSEAGFSTVALPHTVTSLSWGDWDPSTWEKLWIYRKHLSGASLSGGRAFVDFQGVMTSATVYLNGTQIAVHQGGYLPFSIELTSYIVAGDNLLAVKVDGTVQNVPPNNASSGDGAIDYLEPAGIYREVALRIEPEVFVSDVFAKPVNVLSAPTLDALVTLDVGAVPSGPVTVTVAVLDGTTTVGSASAQVSPSATGPTQRMVAVGPLSGISLWSPESPKLYGVRVTLVVPGAASSIYTTRAGFRQAVFRDDGFYLNGSRYQIFGVNRHQMFPYTGMAAPQRVQRRDAEILRNQLNCNMVRCSHYPQSEWFLDACDELGLMVWEEPPGWAYVNNTASTGPAFKALVLQNVQDMIVRDRSRPSVIVWATRLNETSSANNEALYVQTNQIAAQYDGTRQTTGAMNNYSLTDWNQQVFAYDDYTHTTSSSDVTQQNAQLRPPISSSIPYFVSEAVGALDGAPKYRFLDTSPTLALQAKLHAQVHSLAGAGGYAGLLGWCGFDYASINGANVNATPASSSPSARIWHNLKTCGVLDTFRAPKPGATVYQSRLPAGAKPQILPAFFWDFSSTNPNGPGNNAIIFTNCHSLQVTVGGGSPVTVTPDATDYPHLAYPPAFVNLSSASGSAKPDLTIVGLSASGQQVAKLSMSCDTTKDTLSLTVDDTQIYADGSDATRFTVRAVDRYGNQRPAPGGQVTLRLSGPGTLVTESVSGSQGMADFASYGGVGGGFIRSVAGQSGGATLTASHPSLSPRGVTARVAAVAGSSPAAPLGAGGSPALNPGRSAQTRRARQ